MRCHASGRCALKKSLKGIVAEQVSERGQLLALQLFVWANAMLHRGLAGRNVRSTAAKAPRLSAKVVRAPMIRVEERLRAT